MGRDSTARTLYTFDEALQKLGTDAEGFRQLLRYQWQRPEKRQWIRACVDSRGGHYIATLDGALSQKPRGDIPALDENGQRVPDHGYDEFASWAQCGSDHRTGYGAVFELSGVFVVSPQNMRWIAEDATVAEWPITNLLAVSPIDQTATGTFPAIHFVIVSDTSPSSLQMPRDARELAFIAADVDRAVSQDEPPPAKAKRSDSLDSRERATLLCIIGALAEYATLDLSQPMKAGEAIAAMMPDVKLSARTIGEHLKTVREAMDSRKD